MGFQRGDKVLINSPLAHNTFGISPNTVFTIDSVTSGTNYSLIKIKELGLEFADRWITAIPSSNSSTVTKRKATDLKVLEEMIEDLVDQKILANEMFTVYDLTRELRSRNKDMNIVHNDVRSYVEQHYELWNLTYSLATFGNPPPRIYHLEEQDPSDYGKVKQDGGRVVRFSINFK